MVDIKNSKKILKKCPVIRENLNIFQNILKIIGCYGQYKNLRKSKRILKNCLNKFQKNLIEVI